MSEKTQTSRDFKVHLLSGAFSGIFSDFAIHPFDLAKTRIQNSKHLIQPNLIHFFQDVVKKEGVGTLWRGFETVALTTIPGHAAYFASYELSKKVFNSFFNIQNDDSPFVHFASGVAADVCGSIIYTPSEIIKQNLQVKSKEYSTFSMGKELYKQHGLKNGLYKGWTLHLLSDAPGAALYFVFYEQMKILCSRFVKKPVSELPFWSYLACGAFASGTLTSIFTPIDLIKNRIQVRNSNNGTDYNGFLDAVKRISKEEGFRAFFKGMKPSVISTSVGTALTMVACKI